MHCIPMSAHLPLFSSEMGAAGSSSALASIIGKNVEKTVKLFNMKCEQAVSQTVYSTVN